MARMLFWGLFERLLKVCLIDNENLVDTFVFSSIQWGGLIKKLIITFFFLYLWFENPLNENCITAERIRIRHRTMGLVEYVQQYTFPFTCVT